MSLLPKSFEEFADKKYWDKFFTQRNNKSFDWYGKYSDLQEAFWQYIKPTDSIMIAGCGNSTLSAELYDDGYHNIISIDISEVAIRQMNTKYKQNDQRPSMTFEVGDVFHLSYADSSFKVIVDKGTLDALASGNTVDQLNLMFDEVDRVLAPFGRYLCISLLQENVLHALLSYFMHNNKWLVRILTWQVDQLTDQSSSDTDSLRMPVFMIVCTKLAAPMPNAVAHIDFCQSFNPKNNTFHKCQNVNEVTHLVRSTQQYELLKFRVRINKSVDPNFYVELFDKESPDWRYKLYFVQRSTKSAPRCSVFIVPQCKQNNYIFSTAEGRKELLQQANQDRLMVVMLNRTLHYENYEQIKSELNCHVRGFFPAEVKTGQIQYLSSSNDIYGSTLLHRGHSQLSGDYVVQDVTTGSDQHFRQLVFLENEDVIQSEATLKMRSKTDKKSVTKEWIIDHDQLGCSHHRTIVACLTLLSTAINGLRKNVSLLIIGLGGGCLVNYIVRHLSLNTKLSITVVEIDPTIVEVAKEWFDFGVGVDISRVNVQVVVQDGIKFIEEAATKQTSNYDYIIFDVDSKDPSLGVSCPPPSFVEETFLRSVNQLLTSSGGLFMLNLVARNQEMKQSIRDRLHNIFAHNATIPTDSDKVELNELIVCTNAKQWRWIEFKTIQQKRKFVRNHPLYIQQEILSNSFENLCKMS